jgi:hypothetical protein
VKGRYVGKTWDLYGPGVVERSGNADQLGN